MHTELEELSYWHKYPKQITLQHSIITNNINYNWHIVSQKSQKKKVKKKVIEFDDNHVGGIAKFWNCGVQ